MMVDFKSIDDVDEREKAVGIKIKHNGNEKTMWIPKSLIDNKRGWKEQRFIDVPDWFYDKKIDELFL